MQCHIAVTDDDASIRKILDIMLRKAGHRTHIFTNAEDLLSALRKEDTCINIVIMDIKMPGISGLEALPRIRETAPEIPVIMLTAFNNRDTGESAMQQGAFDYLAKPVHRKDLLETVDRACAFCRMTQQRKVSGSAETAYQRYSAEQLEKQKNQLDAVTRKIMQNAVETVMNYSDAAEQKDRYTAGHSKRVRYTSLRLASFFGLSEKELQALECGALLHDIGRTCIPEHILGKPGPLDEEEIRIVQSHSLAGEKLMSRYAIFTDCLPIIRSHHERFDGTGYPDRLKGTFIPLPARIVSLADAFDAMMNERPYRQALSLDEALAEIKKHSGTQFDPYITDIFLRRSVYEAYSE